MTDKTAAPAASEATEGTKGTKLAGRFPAPSLFVLQVVAMLTMTTDHLARSLLVQGTPEWMALTTIGRAAFLLYAFMIAEGFHHVKGDPGRVRAHLVKLAVLAVVSEVPFDLMDSGRWFDPASQSVMLTLLLGFAGLAVADRCRDGRAWPWPAVAYYLVAIPLGYLLRLDYGPVGIPLIAFFGWFSESCRDMPLLRRLGVLMLGITAYHLAYIWFVSGFGTWEQFATTFGYYWSRIVGHYGTMLLVAAYGGARGYRDKWFGRLYSAYYPLHMVVIDAVMLLG